MKFISEEEFNQYLGKPANEPKKEPIPDQKDQEWLKSL
ncbi:hypothetical protein UFOVP265_12 [uncultured Caudovirales phage]|jgi:hypothetical protein|uniref:Uncharacterized protein n=1 Tax=uncultured Caudovirales phage TaxID=2100421 RepID=A0A6J5LIB3_9CAUD|nr:hypothetical protein UFOVP265_12 [uncultured Caudovirales phage]